MTAVLGRTAPEITYANLPNPPTGSRLVDPEMIAVVGLHDPVLLVAMRQRYPRIGEIDALAEYQPDSFVPTHSPDAGSRISSSLRLIDHWLNTDVDPSVLPREPWFWKRARSAVSGDRAYRESHPDRVEAAAPRDVIRLFAGFFARQITDR